MSNVALKNASVMHTFQECLFALEFLRNVIMFSASLSCYAHSSFKGVAIPVMQIFGSFALTGCIFLLFLFLVFLLYFLGNLILGRVVHFFFPL